MWNQRDHRWSARLMMAAVLLVALWVAMGESARAQIPGGTGLMPQGASANHRFAEPGELTIVVSLLGAVGTPGRYEISRSITLMDLIALAGGWQDYAERGDVRITRLVQTGGTVERRDYYVDLSDLTRVSDNDLRLNQLDIIEVPGTPGNLFDDFLRYAGAIGGLIATGLAITLAFD